MAGKHTAGPWAWRGEPGNSELHSAHGCVLGHAAHEGMWLAYDADEDGRSANARLIAAAPELLEALVALQRLASSFGVPIPDAVPAAIARATQPLPPPNEE